MRKIFDFMLSGKYTVSEVYKMTERELSLKVRGQARYPGKRLSKSYFFYMLSNPFYYGEFEYPRRSGNWYKGNHQPLITETEYYRLQEIMGKAPARPKKYTFTYTGLIKCGECGSSITAETKRKQQQNGNVHVYTYYHCTKRKHPECTQKSITEAELEDQFLIYLKDIHIPSGFHSWALQACEELEKQKKGELIKIISLKKKALTDCENKLDALLEMCLSNHISKEEYAVKKTFLETEKTRLQEFIAANDIDRSGINKVRAALIFAKKACEEFEKGGVETKRTLLQSIGSNLQLKDKKLMISIEKPLLLISELKKFYPTRKSPLEPLKTYTDEDRIAI